MTDAERRRILREARATLARPVERYEPTEPTEPLTYRTYDPGPPEPEPERPWVSDIPRAAEPDWSGWESWVQARIAAALAAERQVMLRAVAKIVGQSLGETIGKELAIERDQWDGKMRELRVECAKLASAYESLHQMISAERSKVLDLPALPTLRRVN